MAQAYATKADVLELAPELTAYDGAVLDLIVDEISQAMIELAAWGTRASYGHMTIAAHLATLVLNPAAATGVVTARSIDKLGESYATGTITDADLATTKYGRMHAELRKRLVQSSSFGETSRDWGLPDGRIL